MSHHVAPKDAKASSFRSGSRCEGPVCKGTVHGDRAKVNIRTLTNIATRKEMMGMYGGASVLVLVMVNYSEVVVVLVMMVTLEVLKTVLAMVILAAILPTTASHALPCVRSSLKPCPAGCIALCRLKARAVQTSFPGLV